MAFVFGFIDKNLWYFIFFCVDTIMHCKALSIKVYCVFTRCCVERALACIVKHYKALPIKVCGVSTRYLSIEPYMHCEAL
jgi:hypothetical protein